jgi:hypothetical protein
MSGHAPQHDRDDTTLERNGYATARQRITRGPQLLPCTRVAAATGERGSSATGGQSPAATPHIRKRAIPFSSFGSAVPIGARARAGTEVPGDSAVTALPKS